jgi:hypothetical protein
VRFPRYGSVRLLLLLPASSSATAVDLGAATARAPPSPVEPVAGTALAMARRGWPWLAGALAWPWLVGGHGWRAVAGRLLAELWLAAVRAQPLVVAKLGMLHRYGI